MSRFSTGLLLIVLAAAAVYFLAWSQWQESTTLRANIKTLQALNEELVELAGMSQTLQQEYNSVPEVDLEKLRSIAPNTAATSRVLVDFEGLAQRNGILLERVEFPSTANQSTAELQVPVSGLYTPIQVTMAIRGGYESLRAFLIDLEHNLRLVDLTNVSFRDVSDKVFPASISSKIYYRRTGF